MTSLKDFMISRVRVKMMKLFFTDPEEMYYVRQITRKINEEINAVRRELDKMIGYGLLRSEQRGNRLYYYLNKRYFYFQELQQMVVKSTGLGKKIVKLRRKLGTLELVMFSGRFIRRLAPRQNEVDVLVIGEVVLAELEALIKQEEESLDREIRVAVFDKKEFDFRKTRRDPFIMDVLYGSRVMIIGNEEEFVDRQVPSV
ncbi:MAG: hypothetical protein HN846_00190 [Candidatus Pacebacteria bacterium]|jgi:hypothetical protein|nr:hypothetical protein [Candidatus Paceibacterota bacterium]MBT3511643.1 hypothetical protein [Candidatus Paceibacterota bacterium]MBT4004594.1 hypothetical protein [Candidatus Paceibacterota bacterium]MBT4359159.1 hypothetical protein [Candidatus Paceibacterota bacterium]MBT4681249.1 hypothetical protein [Candidatus Paceibacterota bacterium]